MYKGRVKKYRKGKVFLKWMQIHNCIDLIMYERIKGRTVGKREKEKRNSTAERQ